MFLTAETNAGISGRAFVERENPIPEHSWHRGRLERGAAAWNLVLQRHLGLLPEEREARARRLRISIISDSDSDSDCS